MEEAIKALSPWPLLQGIALGLIVAAIGFWAIRKGLQDSRRRAADETPQLVRLDPDAPAVAVQPQFPMEEHRARWKAFEQLDHIHENSFAMVKLLGQLVEVQVRIEAALNRYNDMRWNKGQ